MKTRIVAKVVLFKADGTFLAVRRSKTDTRRPLQWDLPGGMVDDGETIEDALVREVKEEADVGILAKNIQLISSGHAVKDGLNIVWLFFVGNTPDKTVTLSYEHDKLEWMTLVHGIETFEYPRHKELLQHIRDNQLQP